MRGVVLAGGGATRYGGRPKGLERVGGVRILDRVVDAMTEAFGATPLLVANAPDASTWRDDLDVVADVRPGLGALGGLHTAVRLGPAPVVVAAWDMPFVTTGLLTALAAGLADADACLPESGGRRGVEPLCAAYGPACLAAIERALDEGDLRAIGFHRHIRVGILPLDEVRRFGDPATLFLNVNTPDELAQAEAAWQARGSSPSSAARTPERPR
ncbi:MAG TPA: molybdenum cofactor guanylyltransferase [Gemmatimonadales bacterium]|nr:molybdenum cofactor guanylyltransferase [Gemmatimonadales bacterium]